jgi:hypothetical protein
LFFLACFLLAIFFVSNLFCACESVLN